LEGFSMRAQEWFERWFGEEYKRLYPHRDAAQAAAQVRALRRAAAAAGFGDSGFILDIGCGAGRRLAAFRETRRRDDLVCGIDLSPVLLRDARRGGHAVARADMRRLPFPDGRFDLVACFFTSFGYFATPAEDAATLGEFARVARPGGLLFLDLPNRAAVVDGLVTRESFAAAGRSVAITRRLERDLVVKSIRIASAPSEGAVAVREEEHEERVRLYTLETLAPVLRTHGLETVAVLGDEDGGPYDPAISSRMSLLLRVRGEPGA